MADIYGTEFDDYLVGTPQDELIQGLGGNDNLQGQDGNDTLLGGAGNDWLESGAGNDVLDGGAGNDTLVDFGGGSDTYVWGTGSGQDVMYDFDAVPGPVDTIQLTGAAPTEVTITRELGLNPNTITLQLNATGDSLQLTNWFQAENQIEQIQFVDGTTWGVNEILSRIQTTFTGTESNDYLYGSPQADTISGLGGNDYLDGQDGNDTLLGGAGDDSLSGGLGNDRLDGGTGNDVLQDYSGGNDTYVWGTGSGQDAVYEYDVVAGNLDTVQVTGAAPTEVTITRELGLNPNTITLQLNATGDSLQLTNWFQAENQIEQIQFVDGTTWGVNEILSKLQADTTLTGTPGDDILSGSGPFDALVGLAGNDTYLINDSADSIVEQAVEGVDTVYSPINFVLGDNVENLTLTGTADIGGSGNALDNVLIGNAGANFISAGDGADFVDGGGGNDTLLGNEGADTLLGGAGDDTLWFDVADSLVDGGAGYDIAYVNQFDGATLDLSQAHIEEVWGNFGDDTFIATGVDGVTVYGQGGADTIQGGGGNDVLFGDYDGPFAYYYAQFGGNDLIDGGDGADALYGGAGDDVLRGEAGNDLIYGDHYSVVTTGNDLLDGGAGADSLIGGLGNDTYIIDDAGDTLTEATNEGVDTVQSFITYTLGSNLENLTLIGGLAINGTGNLTNNILIGNDANNVLDGAVGLDTMIGGQGDDIFVVDDVGDVVAENFNEGRDTVQSSISYSLGDNVENLTLIGSAALNGTGNSLANVLVGNNGANVLDGGSGADSMAGGAGDDRYIVDTGTDVVTEGLNQGNDVVEASASYSLGTNVENLTLTGTAALNGVGNGLNNILTGNSAANILDGGAGADSMSGGVGDDTYIVDDVGDDIVESLGQGIDTVQSAITYTLKANVENLVLTGTAAINGTGNTLDNMIVGNSAANFLMGGGGADTMIGGAGNDSYLVDGVSDIVIEQANEGTDTVFSSISYALTENVEFLNLMGDAANATGNVLDNVLGGTSGMNVLDGGLGADTMIGGAGDDTYVVDNLGDAVTEQLNEGTDTVQSSVTYALGANLENVTLTGSSAINATGNALNNVLTGNSAANVLDGGAGVDVMIGGAGDDTYLVESAGEVIVESVNEGIDTVQSSVGYSLAANVENLTLAGLNSIAGIGNALNNVLIGNSAVNVLDGGLGADTMIGGAGDDTYVVDNSSDVVTENANEGIDTVVSSLSYTLGNNLEKLTLSGASSVNATGNVLNNVLAGNSGSNLLDGGTGADQMFGGQGNDTFVVENAGDSVNENANEGIDTVQSSIGYTLGANIENLTLTGSLAINGTGNALDNVLTGNSAANVLTGGAGNDTYMIGAGDSVVEAANSGIDTVQSALTYTLGANLENLTLTGSTAINGTGNSLNNILTGNAGANVLTGGSGNDTYVVGAGDSVVESNNSGTDTVQSSVTWTLGSNLENLTLTGAAVINGTGSSADNVLLGNSANNVLSGANGNDTLRGGLGNDTLNGGGGSDTFQFGRGEGQDLVQDNSGTADKILYDGGINPLDLVISRQANDLRLSIHGSTDYVTVQNWYTSSSNRTETIQAGNGQTLLSTQVDQLIQAMAGFTTQTGLTWDQAIDQRTQDVQTVLAASWQ